MEANYGINNDANNDADEDELESDLDYLLFDDEYVEQEYSWLSDRWFYFKNWFGDVWYNFGLWLSEGRNLYYVIAGASAVALLVVFG